MDNVVIIHWVIKTNGIEGGTNLLSPKYDWILEKLNKKLYKGPEK